MIPGSHRAASTTELASSTQSLVRNQCLLREVARYDSLLKCKQHLQKRVAGRPTQSLWLHRKPGLGALAAPEALGKSEDCRESAAGSNVETELEREVKAALGKRLWCLQAELGNHPAIQRLLPLADSGWYPRFTDLIVSIQSW